MTKKQTKVKRTQEQILIPLIEKLESESPAMSITERIVRKDYFKPLHYKI